MFKQHFIVCSNCNRLKISDYTWIEVPLPEPNLLTHGICPRCVVILYPTLATAVFKKMRERAAGKTGLPEEG